MELIFTPLLLIAVVLFVVWPLLTEEEGAAARVIAGAEMEAVRTEKNNLLDSLKDLEMDFHMGKLSREDYEAISERLEARAVRTLKQLQDMEADSSRGSRSQ